MKSNQFMQLPRTAALVRKYQARWEFCLDWKNIRTIGWEKLPRETKTAFNRANRLRNSSVGEP